MVFAVKERTPAYHAQQQGWGNKTTSHQAQYDDPAALFFHIFNRRTGRDTLFWGYMEGHFANNPQLTHKESIAVDFGCGTGWLTTHLARNFKSVYGIDTSKSMLRIAVRNTAGMANNIRFHQTPPSQIVGACDFVSAVHVHYHFDTKEKLKKEFFQAAADLLKPNGEFLLIGCPSDHIRTTPEHFTNHIGVQDIPVAAMEAMSDISLLTDTADNTGFVPLSAIPKFQIPDGTQMKADFKTTDDRGRERTLSLTDTYWSDKTLIETAAQCGLVLEKRTNLTWRDHPNAYMALHFKKAPTLQS